MRKTDSGDMQA